LGVEVQVVVEVLWGSLGNLPWKPWAWSHILPLVWFLRLFVGFVVLTPKRKIAKIKRRGTCGEINGSEREREEKRRACGGSKSLSNLKP